MTYTDSSHLSSLPSSELIDEFTGLVDSQFKKTSIMDAYVNVQTVRGTDTLINRRIGKTKLQKLTAGVPPKATSTKFGRVDVTVDTIILARDVQDLLNDFQADINVRAELARDHGKELGAKFDQTMLIMGIKGALAAAPTDVDSIGAGKNVEFAAANDETDADKLEDAIVARLVEMQEEDIDTRECVVFVRPTQYRTLSKHTKLISTDFSKANGDFADMQVQTIGGSRIVSTSRIPTAAIAGNLLSNAANSSAYDVSAEESDAVAVILHPQSLLAGETIPMTADVWFNKDDKSYYVDTYMAYGVSVRRPDVCGAVFKYRA